MLLLDILFPPFCCLCKKIGKYLCDDCAQAITIFSLSICPNCDRPSTGFKTHSCCKSSEGLDGLSICTVFNEPIRELIHQMKYAGFFHIHTFFSFLIQERLKIHHPSLDFLCPIPLHPNKKKARGFNQSELICNLFAQHSNLPVKEDVLARSTDNSSQAEKGRVERLQSAQPFTCTLPSECSGKRIGIVDDVATTGTTLRLASQALKQSGAQQTWGFVLAHPY